VFHFGFDGNGSTTLIYWEQTIQSFSPDGASATENDGLQDGWTIIAQEISMWNGNIANPTGYAPLRQTSRRSYVPIEELAKQRNFNSYAARTPSSKAESDSKEHLPRKS
jgi:hypothetical protein